MGEHAPAGSDTAFLDPPSEVDVVLVDTLDVLVLPRDEDVNCAHNGKGKR